MTNDTECERRKPLQSTSRRVLCQGAVLFGGYTLAQACALARNILIAHWLSKGDFGIAATILLILQIVETLSDLGADRLIIQSKDGESPELMAGLHLTLAARGVLSGVLIYLAASPAAVFFRVEEATWAFEAAALVPIIKGFMHLDVRRRQRHLDNAPFMLSETAPQVLALLLCIPILHWTDSYAAAVWIAIVQSTTALLASHALARTSYRIAADSEILARIVRFGWPIWLSAFPLIAVYYVDRAIVGRMFGMEALAGYAAAFMLTMVPAMIAARAAHALMLPLLVEARGNAALHNSRYALMTELAVLAAAAYVITSMIAGDALIRMAFGDRYAGLQWVTGWLAIMWALRMVQSVPGMSLIAMGWTTPLLYAGLIRASALGLAVWAARNGFGVEGVAAAGAIGEVASLIYVAFASQGRRDTDPQGVARIYLLRAVYLLPAILFAALVTVALPANMPSIGSLAAAAVVTISTLAFGLAIFPGTRHLMEQGRRSLLRLPVKATPPAHTAAPQQARLADPSVILQ